MLSKLIREAIASTRLNLLCSSRVIRIARSLAWKILAQADAKWEPPTADRKEWRRRLPDGSYEYRDKPPEQQGTPEKPKEEGTPKKPEGEKPEDKKPEPKKYKHHVVLSRSDLERTLSKGYYTILSAGRNYNDAKEKEMDQSDSFFHKRHKELRDELEKKNLNYTEVVGNYDGIEDSFLVFHDQDSPLEEKAPKSVMVHHDTKEKADENRKFLEELGKKFNQDSVLHGTDGKNRLFYTTGERAGKSCGGEGWKETPEAKNYYTDAVLKNKEHTKFVVDLAECKKLGWI
jgi:hypothetical protein